MGSWPAMPFGGRNTISSGCLESMLGPIIAHTFAPASITWPTAQKALYIPFSVISPVVVKQLFTINGTAVGNGNVDVGIYSEDGTLLVSSGAVATAGASVPQLFNVTDTQLTPGIYYFGIVLTSASDSIWSWSAVDARLMPALGMAEQTGQASLPATATMALCTATLIPSVGAILDV